MEKAEMRVIHFSMNDVIATSGLVMSGLGDDDSTNNMFNGESLSNYSSDYFYASNTLKSGYNLNGWDAGRAAEFNGIYFNKTYTASDPIPGEPLTFGEIGASGTIYVHQ